MQYALYKSAKQKNISDFPTTKMGANYCALGAEDKLPIGIRNITQSLPLILASGGEKLMDFWADAKTQEFGKMWSVGC